MEKEEKKIMEQLVTTSNTDLSPDEIEIINKIWREADIESKLDVMECIKEYANSPKLTDEEIDEIIKEARHHVLNKYSLDKLLEKVTPENVHEEINMGKPRGKEVW